jgi:hypothetical protein
MKRLLVSALIRLYPARWRAEYGAEFQEVLLRRPLGLRELLNVSANALRQQLRLGEPWLLLGVPFTALSIGGCLRIVEGMPFAARVHDRNFAGASIALAAFFAVGYWTMWRNGSRAGRAAIKFNLLAAAPYFLLGVAAEARLIPITTVDAGASEAYWRGVLLTAPFFQAFVSGGVGWLGGKAARLVRRPRNHTTA